MTMLQFNDIDERTLAVLKHAVYTENLILAQKALNARLRVIKAVEQLDRLSNIYVEVGR